MVLPTKVPASSGVLCLVVCALLAAGNATAVEHVTLKDKRMVDAAKPWVDYGFAVAAMEGEFGPLPEGGEGSREDVSSVKLPPPAQMILSQVHFGLEFAKCIRTFEGVIYKDDAVWVSEGRLHIVDMKP